MLACMLLLFLPYSGAAQDTAAYWLENGQASLLNGSFPLAIRSFDRVIRIDPENASAWGGKGIALSRLGRYKMAELCFKYALRKDAQNAGLWLEDGRAKELAGEWGEARQSYEQALDLQAILAEAWLGKANASLALENYDDAMQSFKNASLYGLSDAGKAGQVRVLLARSSALLKKGKFELALACYDEILAGSPSDEMGTEGKEGKALALAGLGEKALAAGNVSQALVNFREASRFAPQSDVAVSGLVRALTAKGDLALHDGLFREAIESYETALVLLPLDPGALAGKEKASDERTVRMKEAESGNASRQKVRENSEYAHYFELAKNQNRNGSYSLALESLNKSLELDASQFEAWLLKGQMLSRLGRQSEALDSLDRAIEINQSSLSALALKGQILAMTGKYRMAGLFFDSALRLDPENIVLWNDMAQVQEKLQNYKGALQSYNKALKLDDNNTETLLGKGSLLLENAKYQEAVQCFSLVLEKEKGNVAALRGTGDAKLALLEYDTALEYYEAALAHNSRDLASML
jgi:tetratricopeptide (TPR) repeat protein